MLNNSFALINFKNVRPKDAWMVPELTKVGKLIVTLHLLGIYKKPIALDELGAALWSYTTNYYMGRIPYKKPII